MNPNISIRSTIKQYLLIGIFNRKGRNGSHLSFLVVLQLHQFHLAAAAGRPLHHLVDVPVRTEVLHPHRYCEVEVGNVCRREVEVRFHKPDIIDNGLVSIVIPGDNAVKNRPEALPFTQLVVFLTNNFSSVPSNSLSPFSYSFLFNTGQSFHELVEPQLEHGRQGNSFGQRNGGFVVGAQIRQPLAVNATLVDYIADGETFLLNQAPKGC